MSSRERSARARERRRVRLASPSAVALAASSTPAERLDPFTLAVRERLEGYVADLGGADALADTKAAQVRSLVEAEIVLEPMTRDVVALARAGQLWSLRTRRAAQLLADWVRVKEHRDRLLVAVGLTRALAPAKSLPEVIAEIAAAKAAKAPEPQRAVLPPTADLAPAAPERPAPEPKATGARQPGNTVAQERLARAPEPAVFSADGKNPEPAVEVPAF